ncbi:MAG: Yip1 family protein [Bacteroidota bacterium]
MIECPVCTTRNGDLSVVCSKCGGYLQARVQTLDLFDTLWALTESPKKTFKRICLSEQKNYIHFLAAVSGIGVGFTWLWRVHGGWFFENNLQLLILTGILAGPVIGIILLYLVSFFYFCFARLMKGAGRFRDAKAVLAYAMVPLMLATIFILPLELGFFGIYFFTANPSPMILKPVAYIVLISLDGLSVLWSFILLVIGTRVLFAKGRITSIVLSLCALAVIGSFFFGIP